MTNNSVVDIGISSPSMAHIAPVSSPSETNKCCWYYAIGKQSDARVLIFVLLLAIPTGRKLLDKFTIFFIIMAFAFSVYYDYLLVCQTNKFLNASGTCNVMNVQM